MSFNEWAFEFSFLGKTKSSGFFDIFDILTSHFLLPIGGALIAIFASWVMHKKISQQELALSDGWYFIWRVFARFVSPIAVILILAYPFFEFLKTI